MPSRFRLPIVPLSCALVFGILLPLAAGAQDRIDVHGFGGWAMGYTNNENTFPDNPGPIASNDLEIDNYYFTLNLLARPAEKIRIHAQPTWQATMRGRELRLDLVYAEFEFVKDTFLRAGKIKNPLGIYTEIYKVGTLRPFYLVPNSFYRFAPEGYAGLGLNRTERLGSWELELDALGGQMDFEPAEVDMMLGFDPQANAPVFGSPIVTTRGSNLLGAGALLRPPVQGLEIGVAVYSMNLYATAFGGPWTEVDPGTRTNAYTTSLEYVTEKLSLRSEGLLVRGAESDQAYYVETAYKPHPRIQVAASFEGLEQTEPEQPLPELVPLQKHQMLGFGLNYWHNPNLVLKLNYYRVTDNRVARPALAASAALSGSIEDATDVLVCGVHFSF